LSGSSNEPPASQRIDYHGADDAFVSPKRSKK
jgi:hypothetical protein